MVNRLKSHLGDLIFQNQGGFIRGRQIQDNIVIVQEIFHLLKKGKRGKKYDIVLKTDD